MWKTEQPKDTETVNKAPPKSENMTSNGSASLALPPLPDVPHPTNPPVGAKYSPNLRDVRNRKRDEARDKMREDFGSKLKAAGLEEMLDSAAKPPARPANPPSAVTIQATTRQASPVKVTSTTTTTTPVRMRSNAPPKPASAPDNTPRSSIYNLIRKPSGPSWATNLENSRANGGMSSVSSTTSSANSELSTDRRDSFDSEYTDDEVASKQKKAGSGSVSRGRQVSQRSLASTCSESTQSEYSESQDDDYPEYEPDSSGLNTTDAVGEETEDTDYSDAAESSLATAAIGEIDDLLDEAMDSDFEDESMKAPTAPQPAPREMQQQPSAVHNRHLQLSTSQSHRPMSMPPPGRTSVHSGQPASTRPNSMMQPQPKPRNGSSSSGSTGSGSDSRSAYSVELYRNSKNSQGAPPVMTIVRQSDSHNHVSQHADEPLPPVPASTIRKKLQEFQELVNQEQSVIMQTSNALNQCCGSQSAFAGSAEQVECNRLLLMACKKREAYIEEMTKLKKGQPSVGSQQPGGSLTISDLSLPLKRDFLSKMSNPEENTVHYFLVMIRNGAHVIFTQMMSTHDVVRGSLDFPNLIKLNDIKQDFRVDLDVYSMHVTKDPVGLTPKKKNKGLTPKKLLSGLKGSGSGHPLWVSPGGPMAVRTTNFVQVGSLHLSMKCIQKTHFSIDKVPFLCPLQGTIHLRLKCVMESNVEYRGFLTMFEDVSGFGAWHRRWCVLRRHKFTFWKYPDDERIKEPIGELDLKGCINDTVGLIPRDICARPNTFELTTVRPQMRGENDTLVSRCINTMTTTRHQMSADTKEDRLLWCDKLNEALYNIRTWDPEALRPIKRKPSTESSSC